MHFPDVELWRFVAPAKESPPDFPPELPFLPFLPGWWGRTRSVAHCSWSVAFDPELERDLPSRPEEAEGRFSELRKGAQSVTAENGPARAIWSEDEAQQLVVDAVIQVAEEFVVLAEAKGWVAQWEDPHPYVFPVVRHHCSFRRSEWTLRMVAMAGAYWGGLETNASLSNPV